jgi:hypothetical protein
MVFFFLPEWPIYGKHDDNQQKSTTKFGCTPCAEQPEENAPVFSDLETVE